MTSGLKFRPSRRRIERFPHRRQFHPQPGRQDRGRDRRGRSQPERPHRPRRMRPPIPAIGETPEATLAAIEAMQAAIAGGLSREALHEPPCRPERPATRWIAP